MSVNLKSYNDMAMAFQSIIFRIVYLLNHGDGPKPIRVNVDNQMVNSWPIWYCNSWSINLLLDGSLIAVSLGKKIDYIKININAVSTESKMFSASHQGVTCDLFDIYNTISRRRDEFHVQFNSSWPREFYK